MKKIIACLMFLMVFVSVSLAVDVGRYQLLLGYYTIAVTVKDAPPGPDSESFENIREHEEENRAVFKIDTATGDVWIYSVRTFEDRRGKKPWTKSWTKSWIPCK